LKGLSNRFRPLAANSSNSRVDLIDAGEVLAIVKVRFTPEALRSIREKRAWWASNRDKAPRLSSRSSLP
jgi:hypothetical protein